MLKLVFFVIMTPYIIVEVIESMSPCGTHDK